MIGLEVQGREGWAQKTGGYNNGIPHPVSFSKCFLIDVFIGREKLLLILSNSEDFMSVTKYIL